MADGIESKGKESKFPFSSINSDYRNQRCQMGVNFALQLYVFLSLFSIFPRNIKANNDKYFPFRLKYKASHTVFISDGNLELGAHFREQTNIYFFLEKTHFPSYLRNMFRVTIWYKYHETTRLGLDILSTSAVPGYPDNMRCDLMVVLHAAPSRRSVWGRSETLAAHHAHMSSPCSGEQSQRWVK